MYSLVLWKTSKKSGIVESDKVRTKSDGKKEAKSGDKHYAVVVLKESDDKEWLESLSVTTKGDVIVPREATKASNIKIKQQANKAVNGKSKAADRVNNAAMKHLLCAPNVFSFQEEKPQNTNHTCVEEPEATSKENETFETTRRNMGQTLTGGRLGDGSGELTNSSLKCPVCHPHSKVPVDVAEFLMSIGEFLKSRQICLELSHPDFDSTLQLLEVDKSKTASRMSGNISKSKSSLNLTNDEKTVQSVGTLLCPSDTDMVELIENSRVMIKATDKFVIDRMSKKEPRDMVRELFRKIVGEDDLLRMTWSGRTYVENATHPKYRLKFKEFKDCVTAFCNQLRQDKKKKGDSVDEKSNLLEIKKKEGNEIRNEDNSKSEKREVSGEDLSSEDSSTECWRKKKTTTKSSNNNDTERFRKTDKKRRKRSSASSSDSEQEGEDSGEDGPIIEHEDSSNGNSNKINEKELSSEENKIDSNDDCNGQSNNLNDMKNTEDQDIASVASFVDGESLSLDVQLISPKQTTESHNSRAVNPQRKLDMSETNRVRASQGFMSSCQPFRYEKARDTDGNLKGNSAKSDSGIFPSKFLTGKTIEKGLSCENDYRDVNFVQETEQHARKQHSRRSNSASPHKAKKRNRSRSRSRSTSRKRHHRHHRRHKSSHHSKKSKKSHRRSRSRD
ncbi:hypothetical protein QAD02_017715 [Eretmocerus hayati]|uniref:Uncharacterized protein n=1 Tax=Eretmocerus hayati TaxID=131215 RepID=A0ACC2PEL9_9HYME|nr:hypothetical protein QAD02_017715 [Eretmocerus hayati]